MSNQLIKARSYLANVKTHLKQGKVMPAVQAIHDSVLIILKTPLMKNEKEEFDRFLDKAVYELVNNPEFRQAVPLKITYKLGEEKQLYNDLREVLGVLQNAAVSEAQDQLKAIEEAKLRRLEEGQEHLDMARFDEAEAVFSSLVREHPDDVDLKANIGERYLKAQRYEEAFKYLASALKDSPESLHLYNRVGIALRKMGRFDVAEKYYQKARTIAPMDANLMFNMGRLYIDWRKWDKVKSCAEKAVELAPNFAEAHKMLTFAEKKLAG